MMNVLNSSVKRRIRV